jgi:hypothetical protein
MQVCKLFYWNCKSWLFAYLIMYQSELTSERVSMSRTMQGDTLQPIPYNLLTKRACLVTLCQVKLTFLASFPVIVYRLTSMTFVIPLLISSLLIVVGRLWLRSCISSYELNMSVNNVFLCSCQIFIHSAAFGFQCAKQHMWTHHKFKCHLSLHRVYQKTCKHYNLHNSAAYYWAFQYLCYLFCSCRLLHWLFSNIWNTVLKRYEMECTRFCGTVFSLL